MKVIKLEVKNLLCSNSNNRYSYLFLNQKNKSPIYYIPEYIDNLNHFNQVIENLKLKGKQVSVIEAQVGTFAKVSDFPIPSNTRIKGKISLHTMVKTLDLFHLEHWIKHYLWLGVDDFYFCYNNSDITQIENSINLLRKLNCPGLCYIYNAEMTHRYKPDFCNIQYVGNGDIISKFNKYAPANFHHIQHIAIQATADMSDSEWMLHCDTDEFINGEKNSLKHYALHNECNTILFKNRWAIYLPLGNQKFRVLASPDVINPPARSKYMSRIENTKFFDVHVAFPIDMKFEISSYDLIHIFNLSDRRASQGRLTQVNREDYKKLPEGIRYAELADWKEVLLA